MFKFASFETTEVFEEWQKNNDVNIYQFAPVMTNMAIQGDGICQSAEAQTHVGLFIIYDEKPEQTS